MTTRKVRTIYDLASVAGVSASTVSRALAGKNVVNSDTATRIRDLAKLHGFQPSQLARNLRTSRSGAVGVVIPLGHERAQHISDPFFMTLIGHLADELTECGFSLNLSRVIPERADWLEQIIASGRTDGLIIIGQSDQAAVLDAAAREYLPLVAWGGFSQGQTHCSVGTDNILGGRIATTHLIERGCRRIAFLGNTSAIEIAQRLEGARMAVADSKLDVELDLIPTHLAQELSAAEVNAYLDGASPPPDGIFAASDMIALNAIQALANHGLSIPDDVHVIGFDDLPFARSTVPPLSTIRQDLAAGASHLVDCLLRRMDGKRSGSVLLNPELVVRQSS